MYFYIIGNTLDVINGILVDTIIKMLIYFVQIDFHY